MPNKSQAAKSTVVKPAVAPTAQEGWLVCALCLLRSWPWTEAKTTELRQDSSLGHSLSFAHLPSKAGALSAATWTP